MTAQSQTDGVVRSATTASAALTSVLASPAGAAGTATSRTAPVLALPADFTVLAEGAGPFDSHVGTLALANALSSAVAGRLRRTAARRLDEVEAAWQVLAALTD